MCFTPHLEVDPRRRHLDWFVRVNGKILPMEENYWLECYFRDLEEARRTFSGAGLKIKAGLEVGFERGAEAAVERVVTGYPFDFVLGSIHCLDHFAISSLQECRAYFSRRSAVTLAEDYFGALKGAAESGLFDCLGHLDLYKRYGYEFFGREINDLHLGRVEDIFKVMARRGTGLEVNTSSRRRGLDEFHPSQDILLLAKKAGIKIFTVGSDAHQKRDLGFCTREAAQLLAGLGLRTSVFTSRRPAFL